MCECNREAEVQRKRGDFFRDALAGLAICPKIPLKPECIFRPYECVHLVDGEPDYAACWDEVERRQR